MRILDTDTCIEILRGNHRVVGRRAETIDEVATTWITACELGYGAAKSIDPEGNHRLVLAFLATLPIAGLNQSAAEYFGRLKSDLERAGQRIADADLFIASITLANGATLVTGNRKHYARIEALPIEDWIRG